VTFLLDTNVCIAYLEGRDTRVREQLLGTAPDRVALCSIVKAELLYGARNSGRVEHNLARLAVFFASLRSLPFDDEAAARYGSLRAQVRREGRPVGANDMLIAAIALAADATLVTRDDEEMSSIAGLRVTSW
jgi:tRNA(fMet)-specific endonuclease VapC